MANVLVDLRTYYYFLFPHPSIHFPDIENKPWNFLDVLSRMFDIGK
jgi:hypothetical protein